MSDFVESAKNFVSSAVSRTSWEAQKQLRVRSKQSEIDKLMEQRQQFSSEITQLALNLYIQGNLTDPEMSRLCASIIELDTDLKGRYDQLAEIKKEQFPADQFAPTPTTNYTPPPVSPQPGSPRPTPNTGSASQATTTCPNCGSPIRPGALYCRSCGAKLR